MNSQRGPVKAVIFDLDGTLIDSAPDIAAAINKVVVDRGAQPLEVGQVANFIGEGARLLVERVFSVCGLPVDKQSLDAAMAAYTAHNEAEPAARTRCYPHVREDLRMLAQRGLQLGVCTNKPQRLTGLVLAALGLDKFFEAALGPESVARCKPDPAHLLAVVNALGRQAREVVYVGDTLTDKECAKAAGVPFFVVSWGKGGGVSDEGAHKIARLADVADSLSVMPVKQADGSVPPER